MFLDVFGRLAIGSDCVHQSLHSGGVVVALGVTHLPEIPVCGNRQFGALVSLIGYRDDIIQLGSGNMYRVTDWDGALYDVVMQYADQCNEYIERNRRKPELQAFIGAENGKNVGQR